MNFKLPPSSLKLPVSTDLSLDLPFLSSVIYVLLSNSALQLISLNMYKININPAYYESSLKMNKETLKPKFSLTEQQKDFIQMQLPRGYKLTLAGQIQQKRNRAPKKTDAQFDTQFFKREPRRELINSEKKNDKKEDRKPPERQEGTDKTQTVVKNQQIQEDVKRFASKKEAMENKRLTKINTEFQFQKNFDRMNQQRIYQRPIKTKEVLSEFKWPGQETEKNKNVQKECPSKKEACKVQEVKQNQIKYEVLKQKADQGIQTTVCEAKCSEQKTFEHKQLCLRLISKLKAHKSSWPFRQPVDPITQGVPNYLLVIHEPMDLKTIEKKLNANKYEHIAQFHGDINKIFLNSYKFNPKQINYYALTMELESYYHELLKELESNPNALEQDRPIKNIRGKTLTNEQDFAQEAVNKKNKPIQPIPVKQDPVINSPAVQQIKEKQIQVGLKPAKGLISKAKQKNAEIDRKDLLKKVQKLSSKSLQKIVEAAFGDTEEERMTFTLDFEKLPEESIQKIDAIVRAEQDRFAQAKTCLAGLQKRMLLF